MHDIKDFVKILGEAERIAIFTHVNPDGDALGSSFAMRAALMSLGKTATVFLEKAVPAHYDFLDAGCAVSGNAADFDVALALDSASVNRLGIHKDFFLSCKKTLVLDHHYAHEPYGDVYYTDTTAAACSELVFDVIMGLCGKLPEDALVPLYTGLSTDTGNFKFSNVTAKTFTKAAALVAAGLEIRPITRRIYDTVKLSKLKFTGAIAEKVQLFDGGRIGVLVCFDSFLAEYGLLPEETEELPNTILSIEGVEVSVLIKDREDGKLKISLRCKENINVAELAAIFGGGGHACAAGFVSDKTPEAVTAELTQLIAKQLEDFYA